MDLLSRAIAEYHIADEDGKVKTVYAYFGLAVFDCQALEQTLENMIFYDEFVIKKIESLNDFDGLKSELENQKNTFGRILRIVLKKYQVTESDKAELDDLLKIRNELAHSYFKKSVEKFYSEKGKLEMLEHFVHTSEVARSLNYRMEDYTQEFKKRYNLSQEVIDSALKEMIEKERKRT